MRKIMALMIAFLLCAFTACAEGTVVCTSFPCYDFARSAGGDAPIEIELLIKPGMEVHTYDPTPADIRTIAQADLLICIGGESDVWVDDLVGSLGENAPRVLRLMDAVPLLKELGGGDHHSEMDEHIWTSPKNAMILQKTTGEAMAASFEAYRDVIQENTDAAVEAIAQLDARLTEIVNQGVRRKIVVADRFPFLYMVHDYGIEYEAAFLSCTAQTEPTAGTIIHLVETVLTEEIPVVYTIEMSNGNVARTIADETNAEILTLHSMQNVTLEEFDANETYVTLMQKNLNALERGLR